MAIGSGEAGGMLRRDRPSRGDVAGIVERNGDQRHRLDQLEGAEAQPGGQPFRPGFRVNVAIHRPHDLGQAEGAEAGSRHGGLNQREIADVRSCRLTQAAAQANSGRDPAHIAEGRPAQRRLEDTKHEHRGVVAEIGPARIGRGIFADGREGIAGSGEPDRPLVEPGPATQQPTGNRDRAGFEADADAGELEGRVEPVEPRAHAQAGETECQAL